MTPALWIASSATATPTATDSRLAPRSGPRSLTAWARVEHRSSAEAGDPASRGYLLAETLLKIRILGQRGVQHLDRD
jgi:hypothetical protein